MAKDGRILYEGYYGYADIDEESPVDKETVYRFYQIMASGGEYNGVKILGRKAIYLMRTNHLNDA